jgi:hypothetical protein
MLQWFEKYKVDVPPGERGLVKVEKFTIGEESHLFSGVSMREFICGRGIDPGTYTRLLRNGSLWMSDTPAEIRDMRNCIYQIEKRGGRVLINGLGLGVVVKAALAVKAVTSVDVVEIDRDVAEFIGEHYAKDNRFHLHVADALTWKAPVGTRWSVVWHDIWADICADNEPDMIKLSRRYGRRSDWQCCWGRHLMKRFW